MQVEADRKYENMMREFTDSSNQYVNPFKALCRAVTSAVDLGIATAQLATVGYIFGGSLLTGSTVDRQTCGSFLRRIYGRKSSRTLIDTQADNNEQLCSGIGWFSCFYSLMFPLSSSI